MTTLQAKHYDAIRAAEAIVHGDPKPNSAGLPLRSQFQLIRENGEAIARALLDAIEELEEREQDALERKYR